MSYPEERWWIETRTAFSGDIESDGSGGPERQVLSGPAVRHNMAVRGGLALSRQTQFSGCAA